MEASFTLVGVLMGSERVVEKGLGFRPVQTTERDGARGIARVCAIFGAQKFAYCVCESD